MTTEPFSIRLAEVGASIELHERLGFTEIARAGKFHDTTFDGGVGILFRAKAP